MANHGPQDSEILVFTFKEGLLSKVAHDLKLRVARFSLEVGGQSVRGEFDADSLEVVCAMKDGQEAPGLLPKSGPEEIRKNIAKSVLEAARFPRARFETTSITPEVVKGQLELHGVAREIRGRRFRDAEGREGAEFRIDQRDFGIKPYSAMLGTLKVKAEVLIRVILPLG